MSIKFGEVELTQIVQNEFRIQVLEGVIEWILKNNEGLIRPSPETLAGIRSEAIARLRTKYPQSGLSLKGEERG